jgi:hypothetical protein
MKNFIKILGVFTVMFCFCNQAWAQRVSFYPADGSTRAIIENVFKEYDVPRKDPVRARAAWLVLEPDSPPYLFARSIDGCGVHGCEIYGFRQDESGQWIKIYQQYGKKGFSVLDTLTNGHYDLEHWDTNAKGGYYKKISRWAGQAYGSPEVTEKNLALVRPQSTNDDNCGIESRVCRAGDFPEGEIKKLD